MCGICGFYSKSPNKYKDIINRMTFALEHRGPDDNGIWQDQNTGVFLGHQRLSIIDLSKAGHQPMQSHSGRYVLSFNGEIYNHLELRGELKKNDPLIKWKSNSDTETLLEAIEFWGIEKAIKKFDGMFAFCLWDKKNHCLTLVRDRLGEKPLYYGWHGMGENKVFLFGSELKALKKHPDFSNEIDKDAIALQFRYNYIPDPYSIYKNIYKLLPGHYLQLTEKNLKKNDLPDSITYWSLVQTAMSGVSNSFNKSEVEIQNELESQLKLTVKKQMISDTPLGAFLSGGTDSSLVVSLMQSQSNSPIKTFTIGFDDTDFNEAQYAKKIANHIGTDHTEMYISPKEAMNVIPKLTKMYDEPFSDSSQIPAFLISQLAKQQVKVALTGDGGDELFCGYNRYNFGEKLWNSSRATPAGLRKIFSIGIQLVSQKNWDKILKYLPIINQYNNLGDKLHKGARALDAKTIFDFYLLLCSHWHKSNEVVLNSEETSIISNKLRQQIETLNKQQQMMVFDFLTYLPGDILVKVDRASMASSIETRAPFLDHKLIEYAWKIPHRLKNKNGQGKWILKEILKQYVPKNLTERPKMGFGVPIGTWLRGSLKDWAENLLDEKKMQEEGFLNSKLIKKKWKEHISGKKNWQHDLWDILMFQAWIREQR